MKNFSNPESFIVSEDIADIIDPGFLTSGEKKKILEYFCYLQEETGKEHKCRVTTIEKFLDDSIEIELKSPESLVSSLIANSQFSEVGIRSGENLLFSFKGQNIISNFAIKFSSGTFHTVTLTIYQSQ
tara:strand:+ start:11988 stop:12371 length:384 start_codon:yes stop_codon:yes gene_type:complete